jgi:hypothetical protein
MPLLQGPLSYQDGMGEGLFRLALPIYDPPPLPEGNCLWVPISNLSLLQDLGDGRGCRLYTLICLRMGPRGQLNTFLPPTGLPFLEAVRSLPGAFSRNSPPFATESLLLGAVLATT